MAYFEEENCNFCAAPVSLRDYPGEGEEEEEGKRKNRYGGRLSALSSCLAAPHCKHGRVKLEAGCRQRVASLRWYFVMQVVAMVTAEGGSHSLGDAMGIFLSTIPGCEINTEIRFHSLLPTTRRSPSSPTVTCKQTQSRTPTAVRLARADRETCQSGDLRYSTYLAPISCQRRGNATTRCWEHMHAHVHGCKSTSPTFPRRKLAHARQRRHRDNDYAACIQSAVCRFIPFFMLPLIQRLGVNTMTGASSVLPLFLPNTSSDIRQIE